MPDFPFHFHPTTQIYLQPGVKLKNFTRQVGVHCGPKLNFTASTVSLAAGWYFHCLTARAKASASKGWPPRIFTSFTVPSGFTRASTCAVPFSFIFSASSGYSGGELRSSRRADSTGGELADDGEEAP